MFDKKMKAVTFSYDDGTIHDARLVQLFNRYGIKATFHINSGILGSQGTTELEGNSVCINRLEAHQIANLYRGHEVAAHTLTHPPLIREQDDNKVIFQVEQDRLRLSKLCGYEVVGFAYPCRRPNSDERVERLVREHTGCQYARSIDFSGTFDVPADLYHICPSVYHTHFEDMMMMAEEFLALKPTKPQIFMIMGHSYELELDDRWQKLERFLQYISGKDEVFYGTNRQVFLGVN